MKRDAMLIGAILLLSGAQSGSGQSRHIRERVDPYTNRKTFVLLDVDSRPCPGDPPAGVREPRVRLAFRAWQREDHGVAYILDAQIDILDAQIDHGSPLNMRRGGSMDTLVDGSANQLLTKDGSTVATAYESTVSGSCSFIQEDIPFEVQRSQLETLATVKVFQFRLNGPNRDIQRCTDEKRLRDLKEFLQAALTL